MMHRQQLPGIDRKTSLQLVLKVRNNLVAQVSPPADVGSVGPKVQIRGHLMERYPAREAILVKPPPKVPKTVRRPRHQSRRIQPIPRAVKTDLERPHPQAAPWSQIGQRGQHPQQRLPQAGRRCGGAQKFSGG